MDKTTEKINNMPTSLEDNMDSVSSTSYRTLRGSNMSLNFPSDFQDNDDNQIIYDKIVIMKSIQMGLKYSLTNGLGSKINRDVLVSDFTTVETNVFPCDNGEVDLKPFIFKSYAPVAFRYFRNKFGIQQEDYLTSFCNSPLRELSNPGASGSMFFITRDDEFILKTINRAERKFLSDLLPGYLLNLNQNPYTLLPKFIGFYCYKFENKYKRFVAMNNFIPSNIKMHQKYDLKGSTYKRFASKTEKQKLAPTYKDLDFKEHYPDGFFLDPVTHALLIETINRDCRVLESFRIMDYSLLLGVHNIDLAQKDKRSSRQLNETEENDTDTSSEISSVLSKIFKTDYDVLADNLTSVEIDREVAKNYSDKDFILSRNGIHATSGNGEKLLLFVGIVDILENYGFKKKIERSIKSACNKSESISAQNPSFYAYRFLNFVEKDIFKKITSSRISSASRSSDPNTHIQSDSKHDVSTPSTPLNDNSDGFVALDYATPDDSNLSLENSHDSTEKDTV